MQWVVGILIEKVLASLIKFITGQVVGVIRFEKTKKDVKEALADPERPKAAAKLNGLFK